MHTKDQAARARDCPRCRVCCRAPTGGSFVLRPNRWCFHGKGGGAEKALRVVCVSMRACVRVCARAYQLRGSFVHLCCAVLEVRGGKKQAPGHARENRSDGRLRIRLRLLLLNTPSWHGYMYSRQNAAAVGRCNIACGGESAQTRSQVLRRIRPICDV